MSARVLILPVIRVERCGVDLARQRLLPSADRRNIVELWRVRCEREYQDLVADLRRRPYEGDSA
ncbi:MAG: hypothetical protein IT481_08455 [Gammaproteobacteria bacterium]|nr:hypothetical protein [Gammaproteobacteria bacterium]